MLKKKEYRIVGHPKSLSDLRMVLSGYSDLIDLKPGTVVAIHGGITKPYSISISNSFMKRRSSGSKRRR